MTRRSRPFPLGTHPRDGGVDVAVLASAADSVELCLLDPDGTGGWRERRVPLPEHTHGVWHGFVPDVPVGQRYGFRAHGPWDPSRGHRYNPAKLLLDPYARAHAGVLRLRPELFGHTVDAQLVGDPEAADPRDSAAYLPHGVVVAPSAPVDPADPADPAVGHRPDTPWDRTVLYEAHVRGLTRRLPGVPDGLRGTYAGLAHDAALDHLTGLGVTAVELLPVQAIGTEVGLARRGTTNYWGYSTLGYFAPHPGYAAATDPLDVLTEFRRMVHRLHTAGLEVILDVVYNHTCETGAEGPLLSWRGLDAATYYRLDEHGRHVDTTGCGNTLDSRQPRVVQLVLDSLRYWVEQMNVDGFRFDLAPTLARGRHGFDPDHPFLVAARADPVLQKVKLIAEPWDLGPEGWRTGQFPAPFAEWNDRFRDTVRDFWLTSARTGRAGRADGPSDTGGAIDPGGAGDPGEAAGAGIRDLATRLAGSDDLFPAVRGPLASINFVTAHDGFTLADLTAFERKRNEANGEDGRDGTDDNHSWNHGVEGPADDPVLRAARHRSSRNVLASCLLSTWVPMLIAGDEFGRSQQGNNNPYCLDGPDVWVDWDLTPEQHDLLATTRYLLALRRSHPVLRQSRFFGKRPVHPDGTKDITWFGADGAEMVHDRWFDPAERVLQMLLCAQPEPDRPAPATGTSLLVVVNGRAGAGTVHLPEAVRATGFRLLWDSAAERPPDADTPAGPAVSPGSPVPVAPLSLQVHAVLPRP
ncbi:MAG: alpha-amylase family glycosyl hydrolase [Kineosporiaceae bacterium]